MLRGRHGGRDRGAPLPSADRVERQARALLESYSVLSRGDYILADVHTSEPLARTAALDTPAAILIVDDNPANLIAMEAALADMVDEVVTAQSGTEALRHLLERDFALLLLDVSMPEMDGHETARLIRLRERNRRVPIIFLTAYDRKEAEVLQAYEHGAVDFLFKPIQTEILRAKVSVFVELQRRTAEVARAAAAARQMEEERRNARRLAEMDRRKDEFLAMLGHELRTPLATMAAGLELAADEEVAAEERADARDRMKRQLRHLVRLVDDLLDVSRIRSGRIELRREPALLGDIIDRAVEIAQPAIDDRRHRLTVAVPREPVALHVDPVRIVQAIANLLNNAARYTDPGGRIAITARVIEDRVRIAVEDNGRGIEPDALEHVFDLFVQTRPGNDGLGLGLTLARQLVELHDGAISVDSPGIGEGTRFEIELPVSLVDAMPERVAPGDEQAAVPVAREGDRPVRVLVIEDDDDLRATLCALLKGWGHQVDGAATGKAGLRELAELAPDVALVDIGLPDFDGCDLLRRARAQLDEPVRFIALTGFTQAEDRARIVAAGFDFHIPKPPDIQTLRSLLASTERREHGNNQRRD